MEGVPAEAEETRLLHGARRGDEAAFTALVTVHAPRLLRLARGIVGDAAAAEDAVQDALLQAWRGLSGFRGDAALSTWLHTITVRSCRRQLRAGRPTESLDRLQEAERAWADADYTVDPVEVLARATRRDELHAAVRRLPEVYRIALLLHDVEGLSASKVAAATGVPLGTAKARIRRARADLAAAPAGAAPRGAARAPATRET